MKKQLTYVLVCILLFTHVTYAKSTEVRIAIIDTGIATDVIDKEKIIPGFNYINESANTNDLIGHGTAVAGIIREVAPEANLVPLVISTLAENNKRVMAKHDILAKAIRDAIDVYDCKIINLSAGTLLNKESLQKATAYAEEKGVVLISSVGNDHQSFPDRLYYPAAYDTVLGVSALKKNGQVASFSQQNKSVFICAPGERLKLLSIDKGFTTFGYGTSYATSYVSGAVARLVMKYPKLTPKEIRQIISESADDLEKVGYDTKSGWGALNLNAALKSL